MKAWPRKIKLQLLAHFCMLSLVNKETVTSSFLLRSRAAIHFCLCFFVAGKKPFRLIRNMNGPISSFESYQPPPTPVIERDVENFHHKKFGIRKRLQGGDRNKGSTSTEDESEPMDESTNEPTKRISLNLNNNFAATPTSPPPASPPHYQKSENLITNVKIEKVDSPPVHLPAPPPVAVAPMQAPAPPPHHMPPPRSMLPHPFSTTVNSEADAANTSPFKPYDAGKQKLLSTRSDLPPRIPPHPSAFFPPPTTLLAHHFTPFAPHTPLHHHLLYRSHMLAAAPNMNPLISRESNPAPYKLPHGTILEMVRPHEAAAAAAAAASASAVNEQASHSHGGISPTLSMSSRSSMDGGSGCGDGNERNSTGKRRKKSEDIPEWVKVCGDFKVQI